MVAPFAPKSLSTSGIRNLNLSSLTLASTPPFSKAATTVSCLSTHLWPTILDPKLLPNLLKVGATIGEPEACSSAAPLILILFSVGNDPTGDGTDLSLLKLADAGHPS
jgi:hypothetical protein